MTSSQTPTLPTTLHIGSKLSVVHLGGFSSPDSPLSLPIGFLSPGHAVTHQPPTPLELENAIAAIEDLVMPLARLISPATQLVTADPLAWRLGELSGSVATQGDALGIVAVEALFNEMADVSLGRPSAGSPFLDTALCGYLLILREFMQHLAFGDVIVDAASALTARRTP